ncbi:MAG: putative hydrolase, family [Rhodoferax sp.]|nr:putative hydrolase, family [Rhodoferax sp.]
MSSISHGVLVFDEHGRLLMAHATGRAYWDIPKGGANPGEAPLEAALRELREETGLVLAPDRLTEIGPMRYYAGKSLHLFRARVNSAECDLASFVCSSFFPDPRTGQPVPEVDRFRWAEPAEALGLAAKSMAAVLKRLPEFARPAS